MLELDIKKKKKKKDSGPLFKIIGYMYNLQKTYSNYLSDKSAVELEAYHYYYFILNHKKDALFFDCIYRSITFELMYNVTNRYNSV